MPIEVDDKEAVPECQEVRNAYFFIVCVVSIGKTSRGEGDAGDEFEVYGDI